jgi:uncharacterized protein YciI
VDFLVRSRASAAAAEVGDDAALNEQHWSYMDRFADGMTARGPTLAPDRETWTGSLHVVDLPSPEAARAFVADEPYQQAGLYERHSVWRFADLLGRTMWDFDGTADQPRFLVLALGPGAPVPVGALPPALRDGLILYGELRTLEGVPAGVVLALQVPSREALDVLLADPAAGLAGHQLEVDDWEFGGRR